MTLDHLRIVHESLTHLTGELVREVTPPGAASTAAVKPNANVEPEVVAAFESPMTTLSIDRKAEPHNAADSR